MGHLLQDAADVTEAQSLANRFRAQRFAKFLEMCHGHRRPLRIIDVGGTPEFWKQRGLADNVDFCITLVNLRPEPTTYANISSIHGDATNLHTIANKSFDIAFSNSVIEHLFTFDNQEAMANEMIRVATAYWVQTPNFWFPVEPHFRVVGWQWLPLAIRVWLLQRRKFGYRGGCRDYDQAMKTASEIRLLRRTEMQRLFPGATLWHERFLGLTKSFVAMHGFADLD